MFNERETSTLPELAHNNRGLLITSSRWAAMGQFFLGRLLYRDLPDNPYIPARKVFAGLFAAHEARRNAAKKGENEIQDLYVRFQFQLLEIRKWEMGSRMQSAD
jgi:hypothetical protein